MCNDREMAYGSPEDNFSCIAKMWSAYKDVEFDAKDVAMMLALLKIARISTGAHKDDNYIDLAGYAAYGGEVAGPKRNPHKKCGTCLHGSNSPTEKCRNCFIKEIRGVAQDDPSNWEPKI